MDELNKIGKQSFLEGFYDSATLNRAIEADIIAGINPYEINEEMFAKGKEYVNNNYHNVFIVRSDDFGYPCITFRIKVRDNKGEEGFLSSRKPLEGCCLTRHNFLQRLPTVVENMLIELRKMIEGTEFTDLSGKK